LATYPILWLCVTLKPHPHYSLPSYVSFYLPPTSISCISWTLDLKRLQCRFCKVDPKVLYIFQQRNNRALEESPPFVVALASWKCKEQTYFLTLPSCTPKLIVDLTLEHNRNHCTTFLEKLKMLLSLHASPLDAISPDILSCLDVGG
jgi:hypothetical protein